MYIIQEIDRIKLIKYYKGNIKQIISTKMNENITENEISITAQEFETKMMSYSPLFTVNKNIHIIPILNAQGANNGISRQNENKKSTTLLWPTDEKECANCGM